MKKNILFTIILVASFILCSCGFFDADTPELNDVITYAEDNQDELVSASLFLLDNYAEESDSINISKNTSGMYRKYSYRDETAEEVELSELNSLFDDKMVKLITLRSNAVEYSVGSAGIGSNNTYFKLIYIPSGKVEDLFGFSEAYHMHYDKSIGGFYGEKEGSDNTYFYYRINDNLYYVIAHY